MTLRIHYRPNPHKIIRKASKECLAIGRPRQRNTLRLTRILTNVDKVRLELINNRPCYMRQLTRSNTADQNNALALQVKDLDTAGRRGTEPVPVGAEHEGIDNVASLE